MFKKNLFDFIELPYMGRQTADIARRLAPYYHCVLIPASDESLVRSLIAEGYYYRPCATSQDLSLEGFRSIEDCLNRLNSKRRNDISQAVEKARKHDVRVSIDIFRRDGKSFADIYSWYFDTYRPYASMHFPNSYKYMFVEDLNISFLDTQHSFVILRAILGSAIVGASFLSHIPCARYQSFSSFDTAFSVADRSGDVLQMYVLNSGHEQIGNINTYLYYCMIEWAIKQGYRFYSFGRENILRPPGPYLNVLASKRSWQTTTVLRYEPGSQIMLYNKKALLHLGMDYYLFHFDLQRYYLIYFANTGAIPKILSQWLEGDTYIRKLVYTKNRETFSYLEKRAGRWKNTVVSLRNSDAVEQSSFNCF
jgi:hypothetical protein